MSTFKTVALGFAVVLASAVAVQAAPHHKPVHHAPRHPAHAMRHHGDTARGPAEMRGATSADRSADSLNAQSLTRAQGGGQ